MLVTHLALVSESDQITPSQLNRVAAALQKQAIRDFDPIWKIPASVDAFDKLDDVPVGYWPMIVRDDIQQAGAAGVHLDNNGQPFSLIEYSDSWSPASPPSPARAWWSSWWRSRIRRRRRRTATPSTAC